MQTHPSCPRCGYDQSGAIAAWERSNPPSCPLKGVCTECGLGFLWRDLLNPRYSRKPLFFEHARERIFAAFAVTLTRSLRGRSIWRWIGMHHTVSWLRIPTFLLGAWIITASVTCGVLWLLPFVLSRMPSVFWRSKPPPAYEDTYALESLANVIQYFYPFPSPPYRRIVFERLYAPYNILPLLGALVMPAAFLLLPVTLRRARVRRGHLVRVCAYHLITLPLVPAMLPSIAFVACAATYIDMRLQGASFALSGLGRWMSRHGLELGLACSAAWVLAWWHAATRYYLRLEQPFLVALVMTALSAAIAVGIVTAIPGGMRWLVW